jgi:hypothetical protein
MDEGDHGMFMGAGRRIRGVIKCFHGRIPGKSVAIPEKDAHFFPQFLIQRPLRSSSRA